MKANEDIVLVEQESADASDIQCPNCLTNFRVDMECNASGGLYDLECPRCTSPIVVEVYIEYAFEVVNG